jgi:septal ring-binding cell division protein DamX
MIVRTTVPMEAEKTTKTKAIKQDAVEKQTLPSLDRNKGVFSVQVYSTLSKKDATDKVKQLKNMNITNVYISEYRKRDVLWYRVRYGEFESYEQAQQEAKNRGFSNAWIDRIK